MGMRSQAGCMSLCFNALWERIFNLNHFFHNTKPNATNKGGLSKSSQINPMEFQGLPHESAFTTIILVHLLTKLLVFRRLSNTKIIVR